MSESFISLNDISYSLPAGNTLFDGVSLNISSSQKLALVGDNGVGKSTLFRIISGDLLPGKGTLRRQAQVFAVPQILSFSGSIVSVMGIASVLAALERVSQGAGMVEDYDIIGEDWDLAERLKEEFAVWGLSKFVGTEEFSSLSGGEKEKVMLIAAFLAKADILLFDEPTNNLDEAARRLFAKRLLNAKQGVVLISHDRSLLRQMNKIAELTRDGIKIFGGNYDFYIAEKNLLKQKLEADVSALHQETVRLQKQISALQERAARKNAYGEKQIENRRYSRMAGGQMALDAQNTQAKKKTALDAKFSENHQAAYDLRLKLKEETIKIPLPEKPFIKEKAVEVKAMNFAYGSQKIFKDFNLLIGGSDRIALSGGNGSGKTTLIKLLLGRLKADSGEINLNVRAVYLSQDLCLLDSTRTLLDNVIELNRGITVNQAYAVLANFGFRNELALKKGGEISGGELLKACLATILGTPHQPEMLILDEPTNNLDIKSTEVLEAALSQYQGALLVVSHDKVFLENIGIKRVVEL